MKMYMLTNLLEVAKTSIRGIYFLILYCQLIT